MEIKIQIGYHYEFHTGLNIEKKEFWNLRHVGANLNNFRERIVRMKDLLSVKTKLSFITLEYY